MINLFKLNGMEGIVTKHFENTKEYYDYLDKRLFNSIEKQTIFCQGCGTFEVNPKDFPELKFCPRCGHSSAMWAWTGATKSSKEVPILINASIKKSVEIVLMLSTIAARRGVTIVWYTMDESGSPQKITT
jgi:hypothetical protein